MIIGNNVINNILKKITRIEDGLSYIEKESEGNKEILERTIHIEGKIDRLERKFKTNEDNYYKKSYAQWGEDVVIINLFQMMNILRPSYIDIGAHHPYEISNTALMYSLGCRGINIEANPNLFEAFERERPDDINICCGIGRQEGTMPFYMIDERSGRNSFVRENVERFVSENPKFTIKEVREIKVDTLQNILSRVNRGVMPDYMTIDIEGLEYEVLNNFDLKANGPKIITLEIIQADKFMEDKMEQLLNDAGYFCYFKVGHNYTWVKKEYKDILQQ